MADEGGINWKELMVDKSIDVVLVPLGLFAALWLQNWVDDRKEKQDYVSLLGDFKTEIATNKGKAKALEDDLGPMADNKDEKALGPLVAEFERFRTDVDEAVILLDCLDLFADAANTAPGGPADLAPPNPVDPQPSPEPPAAPAEEPSEEPAAPTAEPAAPAAEPAAPAAPGAPADPAAAGGEDKQKELAACAAKFEEMEKKPDMKFRPVDLSPLYRYEVFQVYLQNGIKLFKDKEAKVIGLKLGEIYSSAKEVERRVEEIEALYNDGFTKHWGGLTSLGSELEDLLGDGEDPAQLKDAQERLREMQGEILDAKYAITTLQEVLQVKAEFLKQYVTDMNKKFDGLTGELDKEAGRNG